MRWQTRALIQRLVALLPREVSERLYYQIQRRLGAFRSVEPWEHLSAARQIAEAAAIHGRPVTDAEILEIGTGHRMLVPIALWLLGAKRVVTIDIHRDVKPELVFLDIARMVADRSRVTDTLTFRGGEIQPDRLQFLEQISHQNVEKLFADLSIEYRAPGDPGALRDAASTYDLHVSRSVLEHVPLRDLARMFTESKRVLRPRGRFVHLVDFSDHFAHVDPSVSSINFLQFNDADWQRLAGNEFAYHNRLRSDDFERLLLESGLAIDEARLVLDDRALNELENGFPLSPQFQGRDRRRLAQREGLFVAESVGSPTSASTFGSGSLTSEKTTPTGG
jgi:SAM-dependent methyltransferase